MWFFSKSHTVDLLAIKSIRDVLIWDVTGANPQATKKELVPQKSKNK